MSLLVFVLCFSAFLFSSVHGLIPKSCAFNITWTSFVCCPTPIGYDNPCGYPQRGKCERVQTYHQIVRLKKLFLEETDIRMFWPTRLLSHACKCKDRFWGPDCGECWFGYTGKKCNQRVIKIRRNILTYTATEKRQFVNILTKSRQISSDYVIPYLAGGELRLSGRHIEVDNYELINYLHWLGSLPVRTRNTTECLMLDLTAHFDSGHADTGFSFYHRYVLLILERLLTPIAEKYFGVKNFAFPYWDWTDKRECDICTDDLIGSESGERNHFLSCNYISTASPLGSNITWPVYCQHRKRGEFCISCLFRSDEISRLCRSWVNYELPTVDEVVRVLHKSKLINHASACQGFEYLLEAECKCWWNENIDMLHGAVHDSIKGTLFPPPSTIFDPLFIIHHVQTDRLYERWQRNFQPSTREFPNVNLNVPMCRDCYVAPFFPLVAYKELLADSRTLGYTYENLDFGSLSEKVQIARWNNSKHRIPCSSG